MQEIYSAVSKRTTVEAFEIVGGAVPWYLGIKFFEDTCADLGLVLSPTTLQRLVAEPSDIDYRIILPPGSPWELPGLVKDAILSYLASKISGSESDQQKVCMAQRRGNIFKILREIIYSTKSRRDKNTTHFYVCVFKEKHGRKIDLSVFRKLPRKVFCLSQDLRLHFKKSGRICLLGDRNNGRQAIVDKICRVLHIPNIGETNHMAWPLYLSHLLKGYRTLESGVEEKLSKMALSGFGNLDAFVRILKSKLRIHHKNTPPAKAAMCFNACQSLRNVADTDFINSIWQEINKNNIGLRYPWNKIFEHKSFFMVSAVIQLRAFVYLALHEPTDQGPFVLTLHNGAAAIRFQLHDMYCFLPFEPLQACEDLLENHEEFAHIMEMVQTLGSIFFSDNSVIKKYASSLSINLLEIEHKAYTFLTTKSFKKIGCQLLLVLCALKPHPKAFKSLIDARKKISETSDTRKYQELDQVLMTLIPQGMQKELWFLLWDEIQRGGSHDPEARFSLASQFLTEGTEEQKHFIRTCLEQKRVGRVFDQDQQANLWALQIMENCQKALYGRKLDMLAFSLDLTRRAIASTNGMIFISKPTLHPNHMVCQYPIKVLGMLLKTHGQIELLDYYLHELFKGLHAEPPLINDESVSGSPGSITPPLFAFLANFLTTIYQWDEYDISESKMRADIKDYTHRLTVWLFSSVHNHDIETSNKLFEGYAFSRFLIGERDHIKHQDNCKLILDLPFAKQAVYKDPKLSYMMQIYLYGKYPKNMRGCSGKKSLQARAELAIRLAKLNHGSSYLAALEITENLIECSPKSFCLFAKQPLETIVASFSPHAHRINSMDQEYAALLQNLLIKTYGLLKETHDHLGIHFLGGIWLSFVEKIVENYPTLKLLQPEGDSPGISALRSLWIYKGCKLFNNQIPRYFQVLQKVFPILKKDLFRWNMRKVVFVVYHLILLDDVDWSDPELSLQRALSMGNWISSLLQYQKWWTDSIAEMTALKALQDQVLEPLPDSRKKIHMKLLGEYEGKFLRGVPALIMKSLWFGVASPKKL